MKTYLSMVLFLIISASLGYSQQACLACTNNPDPQLCQTLLVQEDGYKSCMCSGQGCSCSESCIILPSPEAYNIYDIFENNIILPEQGLIVSLNDNSVNTYGISINEEIDMQVFKVGGYILVKLIDGQYLISVINEGVAQIYSQCSGEKIGTINLNLS